MWAKAVLWTFGVLTMLAIVWALSLASGDPDAILRQKREELEELRGW